MSILDKLAALGMSATVEIPFPSHEEVSIACRHVLYVLGGDRENGMEPGGFITGLIQLLCHADRENTAKLAVGFPAYATCVDIYKTHPDGTGILSRLVTKTPDTHTGDGSTPKGN